MSETGDTFFRLGRILALKIFLATTKKGRKPATKPSVQSVLGTLRTIGRVSVLTRVILFQVCLLELHDCVLRMVGVFRGGILEIFLNSLSCLIFLFPFDDTIVSTELSAETKGASLAFNISRGLMTSLSKMSTKACWVLASALAVGP
jgi:hypothetical protein